MLEILTDRLHLREFTAADVQAVHAYRSDPHVARFMFWDPYTDADTNGYMERVTASQRESPRRWYELAVVRRADNLLIGACDLSYEGEGEADLGYVLARAAWGQGYASEAAAAMIATGFSTLHLRRIFAITDPQNVASQRVLEHIGMHRAMQIDHHTFAKGRWWDVLLYDMTHAQWAAMDAD